MNNRDLTERDICTKRITPALVGAGWDLENQIREEVSFTAGRIAPMRARPAVPKLSQHNSGTADPVPMKQLSRCGTSIGANLAEANGAISEADLSAKVSIAYKESQETKYWLSLLHDTGYMDQKAFESIYQDVDEVAAILFAILKKTRIDKGR